MRVYIMLTDSAKGECTPSLAWNTGSSIIDSLDYLGDVSLLTDRWYELDVTNAVQVQNDGIVAFKIENDAQDIFSIYGSSAFYKPQLFIYDYEALSDPYLSVQAAKNALTLGDISGVVEDIVLPDKGGKGTVIQWESSNSDVIDTDGRVTRPPDTQSDAVVTLTATISTGKGDKAVDDNLETYWADDSAHPSLTVRMGSEDIIGELLIIPYNGAVVSSYKIEVSKDSYSWTEVHSSNVPLRDNMINYIPLKKLYSARYLRCSVTSKSSGATGLRAISAYSNVRSNTIDSSAFCSAPHR